MYAISLEDKFLITIKLTMKADTHSNNLLETNSDILHRNYKW